MSYAYPEVAGSVRADLTRRLARSRPPEDTFVLSTCLRIEVVVAGDGTRLSRVIDELFGDDDLDSGTRRDGEEAVLHLFRVAAGLESPIVGEHEILTQFRQEVITTEESGTIGGLFVKLLETAVSTGRQARELLPGSPHDSMAAVAAQVVGAHREVAVLGSGAMSTAVVMNLLGLPAPPDVLIVARSPEKVSIEGVEVWPFRLAVEALRTHRAVVSATSAKRRPLSDDDLEGLLRARTEPLTLVDMAMPPDFAPPPGAPVDYVDIDMLAWMAERRPRSREADAMVAAAASDAYRGLVEHHALGPVIGGLTSSADEIVDQMVERFAGRLETEEDRAVLRQAVHTAARTLLASPIEYLHSPQRSDDAVDVIAEAFGLEDH